MQLNLKKLSSIEVFNFNSIKDEWLKELLNQYNERSDSPESKLTFEAKIERRSDKEYFLKGTLDGTLTYHCSRCLKDTLIQFQVPISSLFIYGDDPLGKIDSKDLIETDIHFLQDEDEVNLSDMLLDSIESQIPLAPLCSEECKGFCQQCGSNLNEGNCSCEPIIFNGLNIKI